jgi:hypothetical protein
VPQAFHCVTEKPRCVSGKVTQCGLSRTGNFRWNAHSISIQNDRCSEDALALWTKSRTLQTNHCSTSAANTRRIANKPHTGRPAETGQRAAVWKCVFSRVKTDSQSDRFKQLEGQNRPMESGEGKGLHQKRDRGKLRFLKRFLCVYSSEVTVERG